MDNINILELASPIKKEGYEGEYVEAKLCQDIILLLISKSVYANNITIKGGVVMRSLSNNTRRATLDIDLDFIKYPLTDDYIDVYYEKADVVGFYKSKTTYSNKDMSSMENFDRYFNNKDDYKVEKTIYVEGKIKAHIVHTDVYEQVYTYDGITIPLCFYVSIYQDLDGNSHRDIKVFNMMTRMVVSEEVMFE